MIEVGELPCRKYRFCLVSCAVASHQFEILRISPASHVGGHSLATVAGPGLGLALVHQQWTWDEVKRQRKEVGFVIGIDVTVSKTQFLTGVGDGHDGLCEPR